MDATLKVLVTSPLLPVRVVVRTVGFVDGLAFVVVVLLKTLALPEDRVFPPDGLLLGFVLPTLGILLDADDFVGPVDAPWLVVEVL